MNPSDDQVRQLLLETVDHELGSRLEIPTPEDQLRDVVTRRARRRWAIPLGAAAAVIVIAAGTLAIVQAVTPDRSNPSAGTTPSSLVVTCVGPKGANLSKDVELLSTRAEPFAHGRVAVSISGNTIGIAIPGAKRADVRSLCASTALNLEPLVAPAVPDPAGKTHDPLAHLGFPIPATEAAYDRLSPAHQLVLKAALARSDCRPGVVVYGGSYSKSGLSVPPAEIACTGGPGDGNGARVAALVGAPIVSGSQIADAAAEAPSAGSGLAEWTVSLTFTDAGSRAFAAYTSEHNTGGNSTTASMTSCGPSSDTPCSDFVGFVLNGRIVSFPVTESAITGGTVQVSGAFTEASAEALAAGLRADQPPVPLTLSSIALAH